MNRKKMAKKGMKQIEVKEELRNKLMQIKYSRGLNSISDVVEWLLKEAKV